MEKPTLLKIDTGPKCNVIPETLFAKVKRSEKLNTSRNMKLLGYGGEEIAMAGHTFLDRYTSDESKEKQSDSTNPSRWPPHISQQEGPSPQNGWHYRLLKANPDGFKDKPGKVLLTFSMKLNPEVNIVF